MCCLQSRSSSFQVVKLSTCSDSKIGETRVSYIAVSVSHVQHPRRYYYGRDFDWSLFFKHKLYFILQTFSDVAASDASRVAGDCEKRRRQGHDAVELLQHLRLQDGQLESRQASREDPLQGGSCTVLEIYLVCFLSFFFSFHKSSLFLTQCKTVATKCIFCYE